MAWVSEFQRLFRELKAIAEENDVVGTADRWDNLTLNTVPNNVQDEINCLYKLKEPFRQGERWFGSDFFYIYVDNLPSFARTVLRTAFELSEIVVDHDTISPANLALDECCGLTASQRFKAEMDRLVTALEAKDREGATEAHDAIKETAIEDICRHVGLPYSAPMIKSAGKR